MSDTPKEADECKKLLDNGWSIMLAKNSMGSYTAIAMRPHQSPEYAVTQENQTTDDFEPSQALYRLTEKVVTARIV